jgi:hypothetical protein
VPPVPKLLRTAAASAERVRGRIGPERGT